MATLRFGVGTVKIGAAHHVPHVTIFLCSAGANRICAEGHAPELGVYESISVPQFVSEDRGQPDLAVDASQQSGRFD